MSTELVPPSDAAPENAVQRGVDTYSRALVGAGGRELEAFMRGDDRSAVCAAIYVSPPYDLHVSPLPVPRLSVNLTRSPVSGGIDGDQFHRFDASRYSLFLTPAGASVSWRKDAPSRHLTLYFHADAFGGRDDDDGTSFAEQPVYNGSIPGMRQLVDQLVDELDSPTVLNEDAADSLGRLMLVRLARHRRRATAANGLSPKLLSRLHDYVVEHLSERILVADLARLASLSPNRFALCYSAQIGQSPHQFVLALRLEHAAAMLRMSTLSLAEVAHACGFANQQHLSNAMRRHFGVTPSRYRALHRAGCGE
jgi:AraC family transcriptional regulator